MDVPGPGGQPSLRGARLTAAQLPVPFCQLRSNRSGFISHNYTTADIAAQVKYWAKLHAAWQARGWADLLFQYTIDEPGCFAPSAQHVTASVFGKKATDQTHPGCGIVWTHTPETSHTRAVSSSLPVMTLLPHTLDATA